MVAGLGGAGMSWAGPGASHIHAEESALGLRVQGVREVMGGGVLGGGASVGVREAL